MEPSSWPLVGRDAELGELAGLLGRCHAVVVAGRAGVGKTAVVRAALEAAATDGWATGWVAASDAYRDIPLGALAHLLPPDLLAARPRPQELLAALAEGLRAARTGPGVVLGVDDAHLLDGASAALLQNLAASGDVTVVATLRAHAAAPSAVASLWRDPGAVRIELQELSRPETGDLLGAALSGPVDRRSIHRLHEATGGNPLYLRELVRALLTSNTLIEEGGWWRWEGEAGSISAPGLVAERATSLPLAHRRALEMVALAEPLRLDVAEVLVPTEDLAALEADGLVEVDPMRSVVRAAHPLYAEAVRSAMPVTRRRSVRRQLAEAVADRAGAGPEDLLRAAVWRLDAGDRVEPWLCVAGARRAWVAGDVHLAERLARHALDSTGTSDGAVGEAAEARYLLGEALADQGQFEQAIAQWEAIDPGGDDELRAIVAVALALILGLVRKRSDEALSLLDDTLARLGPGPARDRVTGVRAVVLSHAGEREAAAEAAEALLDAELAPDAELQALLVTLPFQLLGLRTAEVAAALPRGRIVADACRERSPSGPMWMAILALFVELVDGRPCRAEEVARAELEASLVHDRMLDRAYFIEALGLAAMEQGRVRTAVELFEESAHLHRRYDNGSLSGCLFEMAVARAMAGDAASAAAAHDEAVSLGRPSPFGFVTEGRSKAWVLAAAGELSSAREALRGEASLARSEGTALHELLALRDAVRLGDGGAVRDRLAALDVEGASPQVATVRAFADGTALHDPHAASSAAQTAERDGMDLLAAEGWRSTARSLERQGRSTEARRAEERARTLLRRCQGAVTPILAGDEVTDPLTRREREVAGLVGRGLADREVATRLGLSVRTVHAHLRSIYSKLQIGSRAELVEVAGDDEVDEVRAAGR